MEYAQIKTGIITVATIEVINRLIVRALPKMARTNVDRYRPTSRTTPIIANTCFIFFIVFLDSFYWGRSERVSFSFR